MKVGKVYLIGAGPSDYGLLTIKAKQILDKANVVVYDKLVGDSILNSISKDKIFINVGKSSNNHLVPQENINQILLNEALKGNIVARLKGGDPFLFGRGGEELELLYQHNIPFEVIPGITSAIAVPCYNGIPVTHRDFSSSLHIITAHKKNNSSLDLDFPTISKLKGTLVFLMGVSSIKLICDGLIKNGKDINTPCAILEKGTTSKQRKIISTLKNIYNDAINNNISAPSIIVVGDVCSLSDKFDWSIQKPLHNAKVIISRPKNQQSILKDKLYELGAEVIEFNSSYIKPINFKLPENIHDYSHIVFTSQNGVEVFFNHLYNNNLDIRYFNSISFAVVGNSTFDCLKKHGVIADLIPNKFSSYELAKLIEKNYIGKKILILSAEKSTNDLSNYLKEKNIPFDNISIYKNIYSDINYNFENSDYVIFTSVSSVNRFIACNKNRDFSNINAICIGPQTEKSAVKYKFNTIVADECSIDSVISKLLSIHKKR